MNLNKHNLLLWFREQMDILISQLTLNTANQKKNASKVNTHVKTLRDQWLTWAANNHTSKADLLDKVLLIQYVTYVIMLEYRNKVWKYDYMTFSRRIGEIWEEFCKIPFYYPVTNLELVDPIDFNTHKEHFQDEVKTYINNLNISDLEKDSLHSYFEYTWSLVESGQISLSLDLHFKTANTFYNVDYKSGFSSNEKGNTNRLLLVGSIYSSMSTPYKNLIFVRQTEEENNHYFQTLKNSPFWTTYCGAEAYQAIGQFTGVDLRSWMDNNINWHNDISADFKNDLIENNILKYLTW